MLMFSAPAGRNGQAVLNYLPYHAVQYVVETPISDAVDGLVNQACTGQKSGQIPSDRLDI
jgi:hypothetical protein